MTTTRAHLSSATDNWPTPQNFFDRLHSEFNFVLDVCASTGNSKASAFYALDHHDPTRRDGLVQDWAGEAQRLGGAVWMNPPYGRPIGAWMAKARQAAQAGATVVTLVPVRADTQWWHEHVLSTGAQVRYVRGRLTFGDATNTAAFASAVVIYRPTDVTGTPGTVSVMAAKGEPVVGTHSGGPVQTAEDVDAKIAGFAPRSMPRERWRLCEDVARNAVRATRPRTRNTAQVLLSALVAYLNGPCGWDRVTAPDLQELLTGRRIDHTTGTMPITAGRRLASQLRMVSRAIGASDKGPRIRTPRDLPCEALIDAAAHRPVSVTDVVRSWQHATGKNVTVKPLEAVAARLLRERAVTVTNTPDGTLWVVSAIQALVEAADPKAAVTMTSKNDRSKTGARPKAKGSKTGKAAKATAPMSRRATLAHAKAAAKAINGLTSTDTAIAPAPQVSTDIREAVEKFTPLPVNRAVWKTNRDLAIRLALGYQPDNVKQARRTCSVLATFLSWWVSCPARTIEGPVTFAELQDPTTMEVWMRLSERKMTSRATMRSLIRRCVKSLNPEAAPSKVSRAMVSDPYTADEMTQWRFYAAHQPTPIATARLSFIVGLCAGAGLDSSDLRHLRARDIVTIHIDQAPVLMVAIRNGRRSRTVPVRRVYAPLVIRALELHHYRGRDDDDLILGQVADRNNVVWNDARRARTATTPKSIRVARLRNSWLVAAMSAPVSLADVLRASGLYTAHTMTDLLDHCPPTDAATVTRVLANLTQDDTAGGAR